ncbi:MAG: DUF3084 domain-containing protein [Synechococcaceae cyanobacterium]|nr:DUF3084 domain-containing protein [Synechococcaceae cyanobacterium]
MSGWLLILALLVLGGVLSTLGDRLGTTVGKARLSLFNLRPRKTAVVITALTGAVISAVSLALMLLVSERLRVGLFELDQLQDRLRDSRIALERSQAELRTRRAELESSRAEVGRAERGRRQALQGRAQALEAQRQAEAARGRAASQLRSAEQRLGTLRSSLQPLQAQRDRLEKQQARLRREVSGRDAEIRRTEAELRQVRERIAAGARELKELETNVIALRRGDVVIASGEPLASAKVRLQRPNQARAAIDGLLQQANLTAFQRMLPGQKVDRQVLLVPRTDIQRLETLIRKPGTWVVSVRSAANVLRGEGRVVAFPDVRPNKRVVRRGELLARTGLEAEERSQEVVRSRLNLLLAAAFARAQRQGTLADGVQFDAAAFNTLSRELVERPAGQGASLEASAALDADTPDPIVVELRWRPAGPVAPGRP